MASLLKKHATETETYSTHIEAKKVKKLISHLLSSLLTFIVNLSWSSFLAPRAVPLLLSVSVSAVFSISLFFSFFYYFTIV